MRARVRRESLKHNFPRIFPNEIVFEEKLGEGQYAEVWKGRCRELDVAIKILKDDITSETLESVLQEVKILRAEIHPNIVSLHGICFENDSQMFITEYVPKGNLEDYLANHPNLPLQQKLKFARDIAMGMNWLHKSTPQCLHRDLKPANLLVTENLRIKICDFGFAQLRNPFAHVADTDGNVKGTFNYMAPEVLQQKPFTEKCDVYSFGITLWTILTCRPPFEETTEWSNDTFVDHICDLYRPEIPESYPEQLRTLIERCWDDDPRVRPPFLEILRTINELLVKSIILDPFGRHFWITNFLGKDEVPWDNFELLWMDEVENYLPVLPENPTSSDLHEATDYQLAVFATRSRTNQTRIREEFPDRADEILSTSLDIYISCLKFLLTDGKSSNVCMEQFGRILDLFGPTLVRGSFKLYNNIESILKHDWFHGPVDQRNADYRLIGSNFKFLVRFSTTARGSFTISWTCSEADNVAHIRIRRNPQNSYFECHNSQLQLSEPTLPDLVSRFAEFYQLLPCKGSPYSYLFFPHLRSNNKNGSFVSGYTTVSSEDF